MKKFWEKSDSKKYLASDYEYYGKLLAKKDQDSLAAVNLEKSLDMDSSRYDLLSDLGYQPACCRIFRVRKFSTL